MHEAIGYAAFTFRPAIPVFGMIVTIRPLTRPCAIPGKRRESPVVGKLYFEGAPCWKVEKITVIRRER